MLEIISHMTEAEKKATVKQIEDFEVGCKVDDKSTLEAITKYKLYAGDVIHFNMMKCEVLSNMKLPIFPFTAEDYRDICAEKTEEERRHKLCEILAIKTKEYKRMEKQETFITKEDDERNNIVGGVDVNRLQSLIERIERLERDKNGIASDIKDIYAEAKGSGFDTKIMRMIIKLRKMNQEDRDEQEFILDVYRKALGV